MSEQTIYLDYNATTPLEKDVLLSIQSALQHAWGNPSSSHSAGVRAKEIIDTSRQHVADMVRATSQDIIFTSGGTEANNWVIQSALKHYWAVVSGDSGKTHLPHIITSNIEHDSIRLVLEILEREEKVEVTYVPVRHNSGQVDAEDVVAVLQPNTCLVAIMLANNETGVIQPVADIIQKVKLASRTSPIRILHHTDAAQVLGKIPVDVGDLGVDYLTVVGHKFYGPRIGALYCRGPGRATLLYPMLYGGGQERNFRPGTENTGMIAGLGKAAELVVSNLSHYENYMRGVRDYLELSLQKTFPEMIHINGKFESSPRLPNTCNVSFLNPALQGNRVLNKLKQTQASVGAACHSDSGCRASPVLLATGIPPAVAVNALRLSVGRHTSRADVDLVIQDLHQAVTQLLET